MIDNDALLPPSGPVSTPVVMQKVEGGPDEWTDKDAQALAETEAAAAQLNLEFALFLVDANVRDRGLPPDVEAEMVARLDVLHAKRTAIDCLRLKREAVDRRKRELQIEREEELKREQERQSALAREREREIEQARERDRRHNAVWRRASRWIRDRVRRTIRSDAVSMLADLAYAKAAQSGGRPPSAT